MAVEIYKYSNRKFTIIHNEECTDLTEVQLIKLIRPLYKENKTTKERITTSKETAKSGKQKTNRKQE